MEDDDEDGEDPVNIKQLKIKQLCEMTKRDMATCEAVLNSCGGDMGEAVDIMLPFTV